jgi:hypothetical protein
LPIKNKLFLTTQVNNNGVKRSVTVRHQCCYGHQRSLDEDTTGCSEMIMEDMEATIRNIGVEEFFELLTDSGVHEEITKNVTVFVPSNDAIEDFRYILKSIF